MITQDKIDHYVELLEAQHRKLDQEIQEKYKQYCPELELEALKKKKLKIKDTINKLQGTSH
jgi:hypothetical protein